LFDPSETVRPSLTAEQRGFVREQEPAVARLEASIGYAFAAPELAVEALTHPSFAAENRLHAGHYQRLEFVGDAFLGMVVARELWHRMPTLPEGQLSRLRAEVISEPALAEVARRLGLGKMALMGRGELRSAGTEKDAILADLVEATVGAVFLDGGFDTAYRVTVGLLGERLERANA
jgi:ribonuclease-3